MLEIVLEKHSTSEDNERGVATGWFPGRLSEYGKGQARGLGERRRDDGLVAVYTSDLRPADETAGIALAGPDLPIYRDARLRECNHGELNGRPRAEIDAIRVQHVDEPFPGGESCQAVERVRDPSASSSERTTTSASF